VRPVEVLHLLGEADPRGMAFVRTFLALHHGLDRERYRLHAWFMGCDGPLTEMLAAEGVPVRVIDWLGRGDIKAARELRRWLREEQFSIVHSSATGKRGMLARALVRATTDARILLHLHGRANERLGPQPRKSSALFADAVVAISRAVAACAPTGRARIIYHGVDVDEFHNAAVSAPRKGQVIGVAARLVPIKGIEFLIRAFAKLQDEFPQARLEIAGVGPELPRLEREVARLNARDRIVFLGWQANVAQTMARWDLLAMPSLEEGLGLAVLEAMAAGLPVVASEVGGLSEVVKHGETGWLVAAGEPEALANAIRSLLLDPELRTRMGAAGYERARVCFGASRMVREFSELYEELVVHPAGS
jgi:glycosyltransferase involved in cell wall biosynthesis